MLAFYQRELCIGLCRQPVLAIRPLAAIEDRARVLRVRAVWLQPGVEVLRLETGVVQVIVWKSLRDVQRQELLGARLMIVHGTWQREEAVKNLIAARLEDLTLLLGRLAGATVSRNFR